MTPIDDAPWKYNEKLLLQKAEWLMGKELAEIKEEIRRIDNTSRVLTKGEVGYVVQEYFKLKKDSDNRPDFPELGIELKTVPLKKKQGYISVKEPLSLNMVNYCEEYKHLDIKESSLYRKNRHILFVCYLHDPSLYRSQYIIKYIFLWEMNDKVLDEIREDYERIITKIKAGQATALHQVFDKYLTTCPKHNGTFRDPNDKISKTEQPFSDIPAERKAYRFKNVYMSKIISEHLGKSPISMKRSKKLLWWLDD